MKKDQATWLLPTVCSGYVTSAVVHALPSGAGFWLLSVPVLVALAIHRVERGSIAVPEQRRTVRLLSFGIGLFVPTLFGDIDDPLMQAAAGAGLGLCTVGTLLGIASVPSPGGLLTPPRAATSVDAALLGGVVWSVAVVMALGRGLFPHFVFIDPPAVDTTFLFAALGSLLLVTVSLLRTRLLRAAELGVPDRMGAALIAAIAGACLGAGSGFLQASTADRASMLTLAGTTLLVGYCLADRSPGRVAQMARGGFALFLLGAPTALLGAWMALRYPDRPASVALTLAVASMGVGLLARAFARPLGPAGSRWITAVEGAMHAALHPEPSLALSTALAALRRAERNAAARPELFRYDPPALLSVDVAGYLSEREAEFPQGVHDLALNEPGHSLRLEVIQAAEVRHPEVRPLVAWFLAHDAKSATALADDEGPVGLLVLPHGKRSSPLAAEEVTRLDDLAERLTGLLRMTSALARAHKRQVSAEEAARAADARIEGLSARLDDQTEAGLKDTELLAAPVRRTAHGPAAQQVLAELEAAAQEPIVVLDAPPGADAVSWAAHVHLSRGSAGGPFVVVDCTAPIARDPTWWRETSVAAPLNRARAGTLVLLWAASLPDEVKDVLVHAWRQSEGVRLILVGTATESGRTAGDVHPALLGRHVALPSLEERAEDLQSIILFELARLGLAKRGEPFGIARAALSILLDRTYFGGELELRGILAAASGRAQSGQVTLEDIEATLAVPAAIESPPIRTASGDAPRTRSRRPPRSRPL